MEPARPPQTTQRTDGTTPFQDTRKTQDVSERLDHMQDTLDKILAALSDREHLTTASEQERPRIEARVQQQEGVIDQAIKKIQGWWR